MAGSGELVPAVGCYYSGKADLNDIGDDGAGDSGDLFELVRRAGGDTAMEVEPAVSGLPMSPPQVPAEVMLEPPSEEEMAAWIYPVAHGEDFVAEHPGGNGDGAAVVMTTGVQQVPAVEPSKQYKVRARATKWKCAEGTSSGSSQRRKTAPGTRTWKSNYSETRSLAEKRRRSKVNERFKTLQKLVPGCEKVKSNQATTLDRTIQYMKSLQQQVQSMSSVVGCSMMPAAAAYPVMPLPNSIQPSRGVVAAQPSIPKLGDGDVDPTRLVPFAGTHMLLPLVHPCWSSGVMMPSGTIHQPDTGDSSKYNNP